MFLIRSNRGIKQNKVGEGIIIEHSVKEFKENFWGREEKLNNPAGVMQFV